MKTCILLLITFFAIIFISNGQNLTSTTGKVVTYVYINYAFNVSVTNIPIGTTPSLSCDIINRLAGYSLANMIVTSQSNNLYSVFLSNFTVGRVNDIQCGLGSTSSVNSITIGLSVRPNITGLVCNYISTVIVPTRTISVNAGITFTDPLLTTSSINCFSNNLISGELVVNPGVTTTTMSLTFNKPVNTSENIICSFSMDSVQNNFQFTVYFFNATVFFTQKNIVTDSPSIQMNIFINFQPYQDLTLMCYLITDTSNPQCANITSYNSVSTWNVTNSVVFLANTTTTTQTISLLKLNSTPGLKDDFIVVCCNSVYLAKASVIYNSPNINNALQASSGETVYSYLQFYQMSLCPCDLTVGVCDPNCCCDTVCNCASPNVIPISGPYGGYFNDTPNYSCQAPYQLTTEPYQSLLCVQFNTTNILGYYYNTSSLIQNADSFQVALNAANRNSYQFRMATQDISVSKITAYSASGVIPSFLYLPKRIVNSISCDLYAPIILFQPYESYCPYEVTSANCQSMTDPRLSFLNYLISSTAIGTNCINNISLTNINQNTPIYTFYQNDISGSWDNGYNLPSSPSVTNGICTNIVLSVNYNIAYNTTGIVYIRADIVLGSVNIGSTLNQKFVVSFINTNVTRTSLINQSYISIQNYATVLSSNQVKTSGLFGYEDGLPVLLNNSITMKTFVPDPSGLCQPTSGGADVLFYKDSFMQCQYTFKSLTCNSMRQEVQTYLDSLLANTQVAVYGNPQSSSDYVNIVSVFTPSVNVTTPSKNQSASIVVPIDSMVNFCENITTGVYIVVYYSRQGKVRGKYIYNIIGVQKRYQLGNFTTFGPSGNMISQNYQMTLSSTVEFVYQSAGIQGAQSTDNIPQVVCTYDVCFEELMYPWLLQYEGKEGFYEQAFGVMLLGLAVFLLVITYPWG